MMTRITVPMLHPSLQLLAHPLKEIFSVFKPESLAAIKRDSCSRPNFATNMVRALFTDAERKASNVRGQMGKRKLDSDVMTRIEDATFRQYPLETGGKRKQAWRVCIKAIDESARRLHRLKK